MFINFFVHSKVMKMMLTCILKLTVMFTVHVGFPLKYIHEDSGFFYFHRLRESI